jgi:soluble calcium-activated nucleotidase 1
VTHENWHARYNRVRSELGFGHPGYMVHEAVRWRASTREWLLLPRRASAEAYNDVKDERRAANLLVIASEDFARIRSVRIGAVEPTRGFSAFQFLPGRDDRIVAIKSEEIEGEIASYLLVFDLAGRILMEEVPLGKVKYEGVEFLSNRYLETV